METSTANLIALFAAVGTFLAAVSAAITYWRNSQLEKAKWSLSLYEKFYEQPQLKAIRDILDNEEDDPGVASLVIKCSSDFTDYLNFFEFVAFLEKKKQLSCDEIRALFDYYLKCLNRHPRVITFIKENGYEDLQKLLKTWK